MNGVARSGGTALLIIVGSFLFVALCIAAWFGYWMLQRANTEQQYGVNTETQQYQASLISQERDRVTGWYAAGDGAQKQAIASQFCAVYDSITRIPADLAEAHSNICTN